MIEGGNNEQWERLVKAMERSAVAQEDLIRLATEEREELATAEESMPLGLPICPHCGTLNPEIRNEGGSGSFAEFILLAHCGHCQNLFLAVAQGWDTYKTKGDYEGRMNEHGTRSHT
jgi:hypothetical protein